MLDFNTRGNCCNGIVAGMPFILYDLVNSGLSPVAGSGDLSLTRAGIGLAYGNDGILKDWGTDVLRYYRDENAAKLGAMVEAAATNLLFPTSSMAASTGTFGSVSNGTLTANAATAPDGSMTAALLKEDTAGPAGHFLSTVSTATIGLIGATTYTVSCYLKEPGAGAKRYFTFFIPAATMDSAANALSQFDCSGAGTVTVQGTGLTSYITKHPNGWYRCESTFTTAASPSGNLRWQLGDTSGSPLATYTGDNVSGFYIWGPQIDLGVQATSLIRTDTASASRVADALTRVADATIPFAVGYTLYAEIQVRRAAVGSVRTIFQLDDGTSNNRTGIRHTGAPAPGGIVVDGGATQASNTGATFGDDVILRTAFALAPNDFAMSAQGAASVTDVAGTLPAGLTTMRVGCGTTAGDRITEPIRKVAIFSTRLTNAQIEAMST